MKSFSNKVAIITEGSSGIGKEVAKRLVQASALVVIGGRDGDKLEQAILEIDASGKKVRAFAGGIAQPVNYRENLIYACKGVKRFEQLSGANHHPSNNSAHL